MSYNSFDEIVDLYCIDNRCLVDRYYKLIYNQDSSIKKTLEKNLQTQLVDLIDDSEKKLGFMSHTFSISNKINQDKVVHNLKICKFITYQYELINQKLAIIDDIQQEIAKINSYCQSKIIVIDSNKIRGNIYELLEKHQSIINQQQNIQRIINQTKCYCSWHVQHTIERLLYGNAIDLSKCNYFLLFEKWFIKFQQITKNIQDENIKIQCETSILFILRECDYEFSNSNQLHQLYNKIQYVKEDICVYLYIYDHFIIRYFAFDQSHFFYFLTKYLDMHALIKSFTSCIQKIASETNRQIFELIIRRIIKSSTYIEDHNDQVLFYANLNKLLCLVHNGSDIYCDIIEYFHKMQSTINMYNHSYADQLNKFMFICCAAQKIDNLQYRAEFKQLLFQVLNNLSNSKETGDRGLFNQNLNSISHLANENNSICIYIKYYLTATNKDNFDIKELNQFLNIYAIFSPVIAYSQNIENAIERRQFEMIILKAIISSTYLSQQRKIKFNYQLAQLIQRLAVDNSFYQNTINYFKDYMNIGVFEDNYATMLDEFMLHELFCANGVAAAAA